MGIVARQSIKASLANYIGVVIGFVNYIWLFPYVLEPDQIGLIRLLEEVASIFLVVSAWGIPNIAVKYFPYFKDPENQNNGFLSLLIVIPSIGFLILLGAFYLFENHIINLYIERSPQFIEYIRWVPVLTSFLIYFIVLENYARINFLITATSLLRETIKKVIFSFAALLVLLQYIDFHQFVLSYIFVHLIIIILLMIYLKNTGLLHLNFRKLSFGQTSLKEILSYGFYVLLGGLGTVLITKIDTLMLGSMRGLNDTGVYAVAIKMALLIELPKRAISQISAPIMSQALKDNDRKIIQELYSKTALTQLMIGILTLIIVWINIDHIFGLIPNSELYSGGIYVVLIIGTAKVVDMAFGINHELLINSKFYRFSLILMVFSAVATVGLNLIFIETMGLVGAALSSLIVFLGFNLIRFLFIQVKMGFQPFGINTFKTLIIAGITYGVGCYIPSIGADWNLHHIIIAFLNIALKSSIICCVFITLILHFKVSEDVNRVVEFTIRKVKDVLNL